MDYFLIRTFATHFKGIIIVVLIHYAEVLFFSVDIKYFIYIYKIKKAVINGGSTCRILITSCGCIILVKRFLTKFGVVLFFNIENLPF